MKTSKYIIALALTLCFAVGNLYATITSAYYSSVDGKSGKTLFDAVHTVAKKGYTNGLSYNGLWGAYCDIDINSSGKVWDMYSNATSYTCGSSAQGANYSKEGDSYNREHSIPKSWFGGSEASGTPGTDLFHVLPTDGYVNNMRSNYAFGEVSSATYTSKSGCKKGSPKAISISNSILSTSGSSSQTCSQSPVFEPMDEYKGDFARGYFGTMIKWANGDYQTFTTDDGAAIFNTAYDAAHYYGLTGYGVALLLKWHREDPVSQKEIDRNNGIQSKQGNRNPFIDYPELVEYIWGNKSGQTVTLSNLTPTFDGNYTPTVDDAPYTIILSRNGSLESISGQTGTYNLPTTGEDDACANWVFDGWSTSDVSSTNSKPNYITSVSSASTVYAVYAKTAENNAPARKAKMAASTVASVTFSDANSDSSTDKASSSSISDLVASESGISSYSGTKVYAGTTGAKIGASGNAGSITLTLSSTANVKSVVVNAKKYGSDTGTLSVTAGSTSVGSAQSPPATAGDLTFTAETAVSNTTTITVATSSKRAYIKSITVIAEGGGTTTTTTYASEPEECKCSGNLGTPAVTATPSDGTITLTWADVDGATNGYTVTISKGVGYTTECGDTEIGEVTHSNGTNTCVITGLVNGLSYTTSVVANATATICESAADEDTTTPVGCSSWDVTFGYSTYSLTAGGTTVAPTITGTTHGAVTYSSSNEAVLTVNASGVVTPVGAGTATVTASWAGADGYCAKDVVSGQFTVTGSLTITYNANYGESPATTTQTVTYNVAATLAANTFSREGYTFQGWATTADGAKVHNDQASVTFTEATTLYAVWQINSHNVAFTPSLTGATVKVNNSSTSPVSNVNYGTTVTINVTPAEHYSLNAITLSTGGEVSINGNSGTFTMPDEDVTVTVTMTEDTKYTVNWYVVGTPTPETNYAGETLAGVDDPEIECNGKVFVGWTATAAYNSDEAPADLFTDAGTKTMPRNNTTNYYAVFATATTTTGGGASSVVDELTLATTGASGSTYSDWSDKAGTSGAVYAGQSAGGNESIQLRSNGSNSGIITTNSGGKATKVTVAWNDNTDNARTINVYGKNSAYSAATDLYGNNAGTLIGTISKSSGTELTISDDYEYIGIRSSSGALYLNKVSITWTTTGGGSTTTYSGYTTSCEAPEEVTVTFNANDGSQTPATTMQTIGYNTAATLTANTFTRNGYTFTGWNTQADGQGTSYADEAEVTLTNNITLFAVWQINSHNISYTLTPSGKATVQVNNSATTPQSFEYGTSVTVTIAPDETYEITSVTATGITLEGSGDTRTFTMPDNDVAITITLTAKPTHTVTWSANGTTTTATYYAGQEIVFPETAEGCEGKEFVGWSASTVTLTDDAPEMITSATMGDNNLTYYAVFATVTTTNGGGTSSVVDELTLATTGASGSTYIAWSDKAGTSGAVYAGQSAGGNTSIQLRTTNSNSGIITTTSGGKATKVTVAWNDNTDNARTINVYGKNSAYSAATDLYGNNAGTLIGTISKSSGTELTISGDYEYIGIRSSSGAVYLTSVSITWTTTGGGSTTTYSGYTTSCEAPEEVTVTFNANDGSQTPATTTQTIDYNTSATLTANAFTRTGYTFTGWNTQAAGQGAAYSDKAEVTLTSNLTLYAQWSKNSYQVTFSTPAGATAVTVNSSSSSPQTVEFEATVTVAVTPDETHIVSGVSVTGDLAVTDNGDNTYSFTMPANNVTVTVTMETKPTYAIRFYDNGVMISEQAVVSGQLAAAPDDPEDCGDNTFVGWWTAELATDNTTGYSWIQDFTAINDQDYYAVYSHTQTTGEGGTTSWSKATTITSGDKVVFVCEGVSNELTSISTTSTKYGIGTEYSDTPAATYVFDVVNGASEGSFAFQNGSNYLYWTSGNSLAVNTTLDNKTSWIVSISDGDATILNASDKTRQIWWNVSSPRFACYTDKTNGDAYKIIQLYKQTGGSSSTTYYTTVPDCTIPEVTTDVMLVTEVDGVTIAVKPVVSSNQAAAAPLLYVKGKYYRTSAISGAADITWQLVERKGTYYIKDASGNYLTVDGENLSLATEPFTWFTSEGRFVTQSGSGLCYSATERAFVVSSDASASIQQMAVISLEGEAQLFTREFTQVDYYATLCLPYAVAPPFIEGVTVYNVVGRNEKDGKIIGIVLAEETGILNAGQPYVILSTTAELNVWFAADMDMVDKAVETVGLVGNLSEEKLTVPVGCYGLKDNQLRRVVSGSPTVSQYKAYFDLSKVPNADTLPMSPSYKTMRTDADDVETAIDDLFGNPATINWNEPVYNVLGQRVGKDAVGVLIQNGMKFLIP